MIITTTSVKRLKPGTEVFLARDHDPSQRVSGLVIQSGKKKLFKAIMSGTTYDIKDRSGWHWEREDTVPVKTRKARELPLPETRGRKKKNG